MANREPTEMELRVAKAMEEYRALEPQHSDYIDAARAVIRAMRAPTGEMLNIICEGNSYCNVLSKATWCNMIDAASPGET